MDQQGDNGKMLEAPYVSAYGTRKMADSNHEDSEL